MKLAPLSLLILAGCATVPPTRQVRLESDPPGAHVFVSYGADERSAKAREYLGKTPCAAEIPADGDGRIKIPAGFMVYSSFVPPVAVFTAEWPGIATNRQVLHGGNVARPADKLPAALLFRQ